MKLLQPQLDFYTSAVTKRAEIVPVLSTLAATLIVVATLNTNLVPLTLSETKAILSLFLFLIPITLHFYIAQKEKVIKNALEIIASYHKDNILDIFENASFFDHLTSVFPRIVVYIFYGTIFFIVLKVWLA